MNTTLIQCITVDGHYVEMDTGGMYLYGSEMYYRGYLHLSCLPTLILTLWDVNYKHVGDPNLTINRFCIGEYDKEFNDAKEKALEYRKAKKQSNSQEM